MGGLGVGYAGAKPRGSGLMSTTPNIIAPEYTVGSGPNYPTDSALTVNPGSQKSITTINGQAGPSYAIVGTSGVTVDNSTPNVAKLSVTPGIISTGVAFPTPAVEGLLTYRTDLGHLYIFTSSSWVLIA
jgi:hypothetical protein